MLRLGFTYLDKALLYCSPLNVQGEVFGNVGAGLTYFEDWARWRDNVRSSLERVVNIRETCPYRICIPKG